MKNTIYAGLMVFLIPISVNAKIGDCPMIVEGNIAFHSHDNFVEAVSFDDVNFEELSSRRNIGLYEEEQILWHRQLYNTSNPSIWNPLLEGDVQAKITCIKSITGDEILVTGRGLSFYVDKNTGRLLRTMQGGTVIDNLVITTPNDKALKFNTSKALISILKRKILIFQKFLALKIVMMKMVLLNG